MRLTTTILSLFILIIGVNGKRAKAYEKYYSEQFPQEEWDSQIQPLLKDLVREYKSSLNELPPSPPAPAILLTTEAKSSSLAGLKRRRKSPEHTPSSKSDHPEQPKAPGKISVKMRPHSANRSGLRVKVASTSAENGPHPSQGGALRKFSMKPHRPMTVHPVTTSENQLKILATGSHEVIEDKKTEVFVPAAPVIQEKSEADSREEGKKDLITTTPTSGKTTIDARDLELVPTVRMSTTTAQSEIVKNGKIDAFEGAFEDIDLIGETTEKSIERTTKFSNVELTTTTLSPMEVDAIIGAAILKSKVETSHNSAEPTTRQPKPTVASPTIEYSLNRATIEKAVESGERIRTLRKQTKIPSSVENVSPSTAAKIEEAPMPVRIDVTAHTTLRRPLSQSVNVRPHPAIVRTPSEEPKFSKIENSEEESTLVDESHFELIDARPMPDLHPKKYESANEINFRARRNHGSFEGNEQNGDGKKEILVPSEIPISEVPIDVSFLEKAKRPLPSADRKSNLAHADGRSPPPLPGQPPQNGFPAFYHPNGYFIVPLGKKV